MNTRPFLTLLASLPLLAFSLTAAEREIPPSFATQPVPRPNANLQARHESFNEISKKGEAQLVVLGDSITQGWEGKGKAVWESTFAPLKAANFGIGGHR